MKYALLLIFSIIGCSSATDNLVIVKATKEIISKPDSIYSICRKYEIVIDTSMESYFEREKTYIVSGFIELGEYKISLLKPDSTDHNNRGIEHIVFVSSKQWRGYSFQFSYFLLQEKWYLNDIGSIVP